MALKRQFCILTSRAALATGERPSVTDARNQAQSAALRTACCLCCAPKARSTRRVAKRQAAPPQRRSAARHTSAAVLATTSIEGAGCARSS
eukprot:6184900-Pleurochrysis_carterae.AAC.3